MTLSPPSALCSMLVWNRITRILTKTCEMKRVSCGLVEMKLRQRVSEKFSMNLNERLRDLY